MTLHSLDVVVLTHDIPAHGLQAGDLGAVVEVYGPDAIGVEFVAASGRTQALVTLHPTDVREVADNDLVSVRPVGANASASPPPPPMPPVESASVFWTYTIFCGFNNEAVLSTIYRAEGLYG